MAYGRRMVFIKLSKKIVRKNQKRKKKKKILPFFGGFLQGVV